jgi:hypothetical protein
VALTVAAGTVDTLGHEVLPANAVSGSSEFQVKFAAQDLSTTWGGSPRNVSIDLFQNGSWYWGPYTSVRVRVLAASGTLSGGFALTTTLVGSYQ